MQGLQFIMILMDWKSEVSSLSLSSQKINHNSLAATDAIYINRTIDTGPQKTIMVFRLL
jgi:hypothetical protein